MDDLPAGDTTHQASQLVDSDLGGTLPLDVNIQAKKGNKFWSDPENLARLDTLAAAFREFSPVGSVMSLADFMKAAEPGGKLPSSSQRIAETSLVYAMSERNPLDGFITPDGSGTRLALRMRDVQTHEMLEAVGRMEKLARRFFPGSDITVTGVAATTHQINTEMSERLMLGFFTALFWIFIVLALVFRSATWALVSVVPNLLPPTVLITVLALTETPIKPGIAIVFSISLGIAFDNTVYLLHGLRRELGTNVGMALKSAMMQESEACLLSGVCLGAGFAVFLFSHFAMNQVFGLFMLLSVVAGLVGDLILLPAFVSLFPGLLVRRREPLNSSAEAREGVPYAL